MKNPYFDLIGTIWRYGVPWRKAIAGYYFAYVIAQAALGLSPYAFGRTIDLLQNFKPERLSEVIFWLVIGVVVVLVFWLFHGPARIVERTVALKIQQTYRLHVYEKLSHLPHPYPACDRWYHDWSCCDDFPLSVGSWYCIS